MTTATVNTKKKSFTTFQMALIAVMAAITCILGPLSIPIPVSPVPISLTNLAIYLTVCLLGWNVWNNKLSNLSSYWYCRTPCFLPVLVLVLQSF